MFEQVLWIPPTVHPGQSVGTGDEEPIGGVVGVSLREMGSKPLRREGQPENKWVLIDFGDVVVHVQLAEERIHYAIERLWKDCPMITLPEEVRIHQS